MRFLIILATILLPTLAFAQATDPTVQTIGNELQAMQTQLNHIGPSIAPLVQERERLLNQVKALTEENKSLKAENEKLKPKDGAKEPKKP